MALVRCETCGVKKPGIGNTKRKYVRAVQPVGYPKTALICPRAKCNNPGMIWLEKEESVTYDAGKRVFKLQTNTVKIRAL